MSRAIYAVLMLVVSAGAWYAMGEAAKALPSWEQTLVFAAMGFVWGIFVTEAFARLFH